MNNAGFCFQSTAHNFLFYRKEKIHFQGLPRQLSRTEDPRDGGCFLTYSGSADGNRDRHCYNKVVVKAKYLHEEPKNCRDLLLLMMNSEEGRPAAILYAH